MLADEVFGRISIELLWLYLHLNTKILFYEASITSPEIKFSDSIGVVKDNPEGKQGIKSEWIYICIALDTNYYDILSNLDYEKNKKKPIPGFLTKLLILLHIGSR